MFLALEMDGVLYIVHHIANRCALPTSRTKDDLVGNQMESVIISRYSMTIA